MGLFIAILAGALAAPAEVAKATPSYSEAAALSRETGGELIVVVGGAATVNGSRAVCYRESDPWGRPGPRLILARGGEWVADLPLTATAEEIDGAFAPAPVQVARSMIVTAPARIFHGTPVVPVLPVSRRC